MAIAIGVGSLDKFFLLQAGNPDCCHYIKHNKRAAFVVEQFLQPSGDLAYLIDYEVAAYFAQVFYPEPDALASVFRLMPDIVVASGSNLHGHADWLVGFDTVVPVQNAPVNTILNSSDQNDNIKYIPDAPDKDRYDWTSNLRLKPSVSDRRGPQFSALPEPACHVGCDVDLPAHQAVASQSG